MRHARAGGHPVQSLQVPHNLDSRPGLPSAGVTFFRGNDGIGKPVGARTPALKLKIPVEHFVQSKARKLNELTKALLKHRSLIDSNH